MNQISRRDMIAATAAFANITFLPARVLGRGGSKGPNDKLNIAVIGVGGRGAVDLENLGPDNNIVALCDVDWRTDLRAQFPAAKVAAGFPQAKRFTDYRKMLQEMDKSIDAVVVACPDHSHAMASITAMKMGKHVYCEKPMAHSISEVDAMLAASKKYKVVTQTGHQGHGSDDVRSIVEWVRAGAIGNVKEVHLFEGKGGPRGPRPGAAPRVGAVNWNLPGDLSKILDADVPVPPDLNWDLWLGPAPQRRYNPAYLPLSWRRWVDFGTGVLGDFNCHYMDPIVWALDLGLPDTIDTETDPSYDPKVNHQTYPMNVLVHFGFPARGKRPPVTVHWYGNCEKRPPMPPGWTANDKLPDDTGGGMIIGTQGSILYGKIFHSLPDKPTPGVVRLFPDELDKSFKRPEKTIPRTRGHWAEWVECSKTGGKQQAGANFGFSSTLTKIALLGNIAIRNTPQTMKLDTRKGLFINNDDANKLFQRRYRDGWQLPG